MNVKVLLLGFACSAILGAGDLDLRLSFASLTPGGQLANETVDENGKRTGQLFQPSGNLRLAGLGVAYTFLSHGDFRYRVALEGAASVQNPDAVLRFLGNEFVNHYLEAEGTLKATSVNAGLEAVYVSAGAGEYGVTLEARDQTYTFGIDQGLKDFPGDTSVVNGQRLHKRMVDPFLSVHGTFVQQYESFGLFSRLGFGINLRRTPGIAKFPEAEFEAVSSSLLEALRPRQELRLSLGIRF